MKTVCCLLIDDDFDEHEFFLLALEYNYDCSRCWCASSCFDAVEKIRRDGYLVPDHIFLDWHVAGLDARFGIATLRQLEALRSKPLFIVSGVPPFLSREEAAALGIKNVLKKHGSMELYARALAEAIESL